MAFNPISVGGLGNVAGAGLPTNAAESFGSVLKRQGVEQASQTLAKPEASSLSRVEPGPSRVEAQNATRPAVSEVSAAASKTLESVGSAQAKMDEILKLAESGKSFSPAELLALQTQVYRASQELDLAGKVVEKATGGVKQVLQTQV